MLTGTVVAQAIALGAMPFMSRLYSPEDFGRYQVYLAVLNVLLVFAAFRYEVGLLTAKTTASFCHLIALVLRVSLLTSGLSALVIWFGFDFFDGRLEGVTSVLLLLAPAMFVGGIYQALIMVPVRERDYKLSAKAKVGQSIGFVGSSLGFAFGPFSAIGMVVADMVGRFFGSLIVVSNNRPLMAKLASSPPRGALHDVAVEHREYPLLTFPGALLSALAGLSPTIAFAQLFDHAVIGQYALVERCILVPIGIVAVAVGQVFTGDFASTIRDHPENAYESLKRVLRVLIYIGLPGSIFGYFALPWAVPFVFGDQWQLAGQLAALAMPLALSTFIAAPVHMTLLLLHRAGLQISWEAGRFLLMSATLLFLQSHDQVAPQVVMATLAVVSCFAYIVFLFLALNAAARLAARP